MSDQSEPADDVVQNDPAGMRKVLEAQGRELADAKSQLAALQRDKAFSEAGVPTGEPGSVWDLFRNSYQGELDATAIAEAKTKLGIPEPSTPSQVAPPADQTTPTPEQQQEAAALQDMSQVRQEFSGTSTAPTAVQEMLAQAKTPEDIEKAMASIGRLAEYD